MSTSSKILVLGLFLLANACGASTVAGSTRGGGAAGPSGGAGLDRTFEANPPPNREQPMFDRQVDHEESTARENPGFRYERDCWQCR